MRKRRTNSGRGDVVTVEAGSCEVAVLGLFDEVLSHHKAAYTNGSHAKVLLNHDDIEWLIEALGGAKRIRPRQTLKAQLMVAVFEALNGNRGRALDSSDDFAIVAMCLVEALDKVLASNE